MPERRAASSAAWSGWGRPPLACHVMSDVMPHIRVLNGEGPDGFEIVYRWYPDGAALCPRTGVFQPKGKQTVKNWGPPDAKTQLCRLAHVIRDARSYYYQNFPALRSNWLPARRCLALLVGAEAADPRQHGLRDPVAMLWRVQEQLLGPVDDDAGLQQQRGHLGVHEHDQPVVTKDAGLGVEELPALSWNVFQVVARVSKTLLLQSDPEQVAERQAVSEPLVLARDEQRMARELVAVGTAPALVLPFFLVALLDVVVMDGHEQVDIECVRPCDPLEQLRLRGTGCDEEMRLVETGILERLLQLLRQAEIENIFLHAACAGCALVLNRMPDVERDLEALGLAADALSLGAGFRGRTCWLAHQETNQETCGYD